MRLLIDISNSINQSKLWDSSSDIDLSEESLGDGHEPATFRNDLKGWGGLIFGPVGWERERLVRSRVDDVSVEAHVRLGRVSREWASWSRRGKAEDRGGKDEEKLAHFEAKSEVSAGWSLPLYPRMTLFIREFCDN